jgi:hypothetical protein
MSTCGLVLTEGEDSYRDRSCGLSRCQPAEVQDFDLEVSFACEHLVSSRCRISAYYNELRTHRSLDKGAPIHRAIQHVGCIISAPVVCTENSDSGVVVMQPTDESM